MSLKVRFALYYGLGSLLFLALLGAVGFVLWQELAAACPAPLQEFLAVKYGP